MRRNVVRCTLYLHWSLQVLFSLCWGKYWNINILQMQIQCFYSHQKQTFIQTKMPHSWPERFNHTIISITYKTGNFHTEQNIFLIELTFQDYWFHFQMRKISNFNQKLYKEEPLLHCHKSQCVNSEVTVNGHHVCGDYILKIHWF